MAVSALFLVNGALVANVLPRLPLIKATLGLSNAELGAAIAAMPIGGLIAGGLAGLLITRFGSARVTVLTGLVYGLLLVSVGLAPSWPLLAASFLVLGALDAVMDAAQNAHGIVVQQRYGRSILQSFHGWWSAGTLVGGATGALAAAASVPIPVHLALAGLALAAVSVGSSGLLLPGRDVDRAAETEAGELPLRVRDLPWILRLLGPLALLGLLGVMLEDAAATWSSVYLVDVLRTSAGIAALSFVTYTAAMTAGRLTNDRWVDRWGATTVARSGGLIAAGGLALVILAGGAAVPLLAFVGFVGVGIGASSMFPVMIVAAGSRPGLPAAHGVALVSWLARAGLVVAPALVGATADVVGLAAAFVIPLVAGVLTAMFAPSLLATRRASRAAA